MISCHTCFHQNKLGAVYCHKCGTRLQVDARAIEQSVLGTAKNERDTKFRLAGRSACMLFLFLFMCLLLVRFAVLPPTPAVMSPPPIMQTVIDDTPNKPAETNIPDQTTGRFLSWRLSQGPLLRKELGYLDNKMAAWHKTILSAVRSDGTVEGDDVLATTALSALALQACPFDEATQEAIVRMQKYLLASSKNLQRKHPLTCALVVAALLDWNELPASIYNDVEIALIDGKAQEWQAWLLPLHYPTQRPKELAALRTDAQHHVWLSFIRLIDPQRTITTAPITDIDPTKLNTSELRMAWAFSAWYTPAHLPLIKNTLSAWSNTDPAPVSFALQALCGRIAQPCVAQLTLASPWRMPPTWLGTPIVH
jgi:hypothetical protein